MPANARASLAASAQRPSCRSCAAEPAAASTAGLSERPRRREVFAQLPPTRSPAAEPAHRNRQCDPPDRAVESPPMQLTELQPAELLALVAVTRAIVRADGQVSPEEGRMVAKIALAVGEETYRRTFAQSVEHFTDEASLKRFLESIS